MALNQHLGKSENRLRISGQWAQVRLQPWPGVSPQLSHEGEKLSYSGSGAEISPGVRAVRAEVQQGVTGPRSYPRLQTWPPGLIQKATPSFTGPQDCQPQLQHSLVSKEFTKTVIFKERRCFCLTDEEEHSELVRIMLDRPQSTSHGVRSSGVSGRWGVPPAKEQVAKLAWKALVLPGVSGASPGRQHAEPCPERSALLSGALGRVVMTLTCTPLSPVFDGGVRCWRFLKPRTQRSDKSLDF